MQIIPKTYHNLKRRLNIKNKSDYDIETNIKCGIFYFSELLSDFSVIYALAAYNAGPVQVNRWLKENKYKDDYSFVELIPFSETKNYIKKIISSYHFYDNI